MERALRPPGNWKPEYHAAFKALPIELQREIRRREQDVSRMMEQSQATREQFGLMRETLAPFMANIRASNNGDVIGAMRSLFNADHTLRHGSAGEKAALVADIIRNYRVDIESLDRTLAGQPVQNAPEQAMVQMLRREMAEQLAPIQRHFGALQSRQQAEMARVRAQATTDVAEFSEDDSHEHIERVREDMADLMELAARRGIAMSLQEAYDRSVALYPDLMQAVNAQRDAQRASAAADAAQRARRAAVSIPSGGAPTGAPNGNLPQSLRDDITAAWAAHERR